MIGRGEGLGGLARDGDFEEDEKSDSMVNRTRQTGMRDAATGLILVGGAVLLMVSLVFYDPRQVPLWVPLIATTNVPGNVGSNPCGVLGAVAAGYLYFLFGAAAFVWTIILAGFGVAKLTIPKFLILERLAWSGLLVISGAALAQMQPWFFSDWSQRLEIEGPGGWVGKWVVKGAFEASLGPVGAPLVLGAIYFASLILAVGFHPVLVLRELWMRAMQRAEAEKKIKLARMAEEERIELERRELERRTQRLAKKVNKSGKGNAPRERVENSEPDREGEAEEPRIIDANAPSGRRPTLAEIEAARKNSAALTCGLLSDLRLENYQLPPMSLLDELTLDDRQPTNYEELRAIQQTILETLLEFGIEATPGDITFGPTITRYEVKPVKGVRVDRIANLERDIARATRASRINILAPIPGKDTVGIEIANSKKVKVTLRELLETEEWLGSSCKLPLALGKDVYGRPIIADLAKMPHCLVAGTTGSGKSVCINSIIASLLFRFSPAELRFIMIDPKVVEMQLYNKLPHLVTPVVTDPKKVLLALKWVVDEMELRYKIFAKVGVRNISGFSDYLRTSSEARKSESGNETREKAPSDEPLGKDAEQDVAENEADVKPARNQREDDVVIPSSMPYIVVIIDELADLMQTAPAEVESAIARITQMARAAGIHVIVATQTPRADVVTGIIKANIPTRIAFQVASGLDSRVILDQKGAEKLLGQGDMLYLPPGSSELKRAQGVFVNDEELHRVVEFVAGQAEPMFEASIHEKMNSGDSALEDVTEEEEELVKKFLEIMKQERRASTSMFQRRLRLGYSRAARIVDIMEKRGILGPVNGAKDREILIDLDSV